MTGHLTMRWSFEVIWSSDNVTKIVTRRKIVPFGWSPDNEHFTNIKQIFMLSTTIKSMKITEIYDYSVAGHDFCI